ncbi:MAG: sodium:calcium antiporter [Dethiobacter sp.]|jgi:cation:H+ antiporter|nr:sodium:calcium antiporter [Dethiobacter sp.]
MATLWIQFLVSAFLIIVAGTGLTRNAEAISRHTGLGALWAGVFLLPLATSLPELVTSWRSAIIGAPDLAVGNVFGSNMFNIFIIAMIDLSHGNSPLLTRVSQRHIFTATFSMLVTAFVAVNILMPSSFRLGWLGLDTVAILAFYLLGNWLLSRFERRHAVQASALEGSSAVRPLGQALFFFILAALVIVVAGTILADTGEAIARETGMGQTLFGSFFIAVTTSLPEVVTTFTAVRLGVLDMAIGNIFGANFFNLLILFFADLFYRPGPIMQVISGSHLVTALMSIILTCLAVIGLIYRSQRCFVRLGYDSMAIVFGYFIALLLLFLAAF